MTRSTTSKPWRRLSNATHIERHRELANDMLEELADRSGEFDMPGDDIRLTVRQAPTRVRLIYPDSEVEIALRGPLQDDGFSTLRMLLGCRVRREAIAFENIVRIRHRRRGTRANDKSRRPR